MDKLGDHFKTAFLTGASSGLGAAFLQMLCNEGVTVYAASRFPENLPHQEGLIGVRLDLAQPVSLTAFREESAEWLGEVDLLINNAGYGVFAPFEDFPPEEIGEQLRVMLEGPIALTREVFAPMRARGHGAVVNVSSLAASLPLPYMSLYDAAKAGLSGFTQALMLESAGSGVTVIDLQPGDFRTAFNRQMRVDREALRERPEVERVYLANESHLEHGPDPQMAAAALRKRLLRRKTGTLRVGSPLQTVGGMAAARLLPGGLLRWVLRKYHAIR